MKTPSDLIKTPKNSADAEKASGTSIRSKARFFEEETPETNGKRSDENSRQPKLEVAIGNSELKLEEESEEELLRQPGLEQTGGNSIELMLKELDESLKKLKLELKQLEQAGEDSMELTPEEESELKLELKKLEQEGINSMEPTPEEELDLEIKLMEQQLKKEGEEKRRENQLKKDKEAKEQLESSQAKNRVNFSPLITPSRNPNDLLGGMSAKGGAAAEWELGEEEPEIENRNRPGFFTIIGNMRSISSFCRSLLPNRGAAAEGELVVEEAHKQDCNEEQMGLVEMGELLKITKEDTHKALEDARKALKERAAENKKSEQRIEALREKQARGESGPSAISARSKATTVSNPLNPRQNPKR